MTHPPVDNDTPPSKSERKRQMSGLQDMGAELLELSEQQLAQIELPDSLREAVSAARQITKFEARRRQLQYIGKLMRSVDPEPIRAQLDLWKNTSDEHKAWLHQLERWRDRLLADEAALHELVVAHPQADVQQLRTLIRNTVRERELNKPPRSYRALFQLLREILAEKPGREGRRERTEE